MKLHVLLIIGCVVGVISCSHEKPEFYKGGSYVQFWRENPDGSSGSVVSPINYPWINSSRTYDTAWFRVQAVGILSSKDRKIRIEQYDQEEEYYIQAIAGVHYIPFDDPELQKYMVIPGDSTEVLIPVVLKYDPNTSNSMSLHLRLVPTEDFELGQAGWTRGRYSYSNY